MVAAAATAEHSVVGYSAGAALRAASLSTAAASSSRSRLRSLEGHGQQRLKRAFDIRTARTGRHLPSLQGAHVIWPASS
jgi:hypothetical protein